MAKKKRCGKNVKKAGNVGIARDCGNRKKKIAILDGPEKMKKIQKKGELKKERGFFNFFFNFFKSQ